MEFWDQKIVAGVKSGINGWFRRTYTFLPPNIRPQLMHVLCGDALSNRSRRYFIPVLGRRR